MVSFNSVTIVLPTLLFLVAVFGGTLLKFTVGAGRSARLRLVAKPWYAGGEHAHDRSELLGTQRPQARQIDDGDDDGEQYRGQNRLTPVHSAVVGADMRSDQPVDAVAAQQADRAGGYRGHQRLRIGGDDALVVHIAVETGAEHVCKQRIRQDEAHRNRQSDDGDTAWAAE